MKTRVLSGDISKVKADSLITAINSGGMWFGGIDGVIRRAAGNQFHVQAAQAMPLTDGQTVVVAGGTQVADSFNSVIFVVDDLIQPLRSIIYKGLKAAHDKGFKTVTLPTIRMGVMLGVVEKSKWEAVSEMFEGVAMFREEQDSDLEITFVVFNDAETEDLLKQAFNR